MNLTRHYENLLVSRDAQSSSSNFVINPNMAQSLQRLSQHLRGLLKTMAGENYDPFQNVDPDYDGLGIDSLDLRELNNLLEALDEQGAAGYPGNEGRQDWALERECEISRLETENEELRKILGIDEATISARGLTVEADRIESGRTYLSSARRALATENYANRPSYWDTNGQPTGPLQRPMELQPGMRAGPQARRTGIFGAGQQRGVFVGGVGRGMNMGVGGTPTPVNLSLWIPQPNTPIPAPPSDRPWHLQGGSSGIDLNR